MHARLPPLLLLGLVGCSSQRPDAAVDWTPVAPPDLGQVVGRVGEVPIFASQVLAEGKRTGRSVGEALDDLLTLHVLAERARRQGLHPATSTDPDVKGALVQRLLERELEPSLRPEAIPDHVLRPMYEKVRDVFVHPRLVDVGVLSIYTGVLMKSEPRNERAQVGRELAAWLEQHPPKSLEDFAALGRNPTWTSRHVSYSRFLQGTDRPLSKVVAPAIAALERDGDMTRLLADEDGFYIARYAGERPPENISFQQARAKLVEGYLDHWRRQQFQEYTGKLVQARRVVAFFDRLNEQGP